MLTGGCLSRRPLVVVAREGQLDGDLFRGRTAGSGESSRRRFGRVRPCARGSDVAVAELEVVAGVLAGATDVVVRVPAAVSGNRNSDEMNR